MPQRWSNMQEVSSLPSFYSVALPWLIIGVLIVQWLVCMTQPGYFRNLISSAFHIDSEHSSEQLPSIGTQIGQWLFNESVFALAITCIGLSEGTWQALGVSILSITVIDLARVIITALAAYIFIWGKRYSQLYLRYYSLRSLFAIILLVMAVASLQRPENDLWLICSIILMVTYLILLTVQCCRQVVSDLRQVLYIIIYIIVVELLPYLCLYRSSIL